MLIEQPPGHHPTTNTTNTTTAIITTTLQPRLRSNPRSDIAVAFDEFIGTVRWYRYGRNGFQAKREQLRLKQEEGRLVDAEAFEALFAPLVIKWRDYLRGPFIEVLLADETDDVKAEKRHGFASWSRAFAGKCSRTLTSI